jgi:hypothetical protein
LVVLGVLISEPRCEREEGLRIPLPAGGSAINPHRSMFPRGRPGCAPSLTFLILRPR